MQVEHKRIERAELFAKIIQLISLRGTCNRLQVGCIITQDNRIVSSGYNGPPKGEDHCNPITCDVNKSCIRSTHAEVNAIKGAMENGVDIFGSTLWCTHSPCLECAKEIYRFSVSEVNYLLDFRSPDGIDYLRLMGIKVNKL